MRIDFYLPNLNVGGVQRRTLRLIKGLMGESQFQVSLILGARVGGLISLLPKDLMVYELSKSSGAISEIASLYSHIKKNRPSVIISCMGRDFIKCLIASLFFSNRKSPKLIVIQAVPAILEDCGWLENKLRSISIRLFYPFAYRVICVSTDVKLSLMQICNNSLDNSVVIYNPVVNPEISDLSKIRVIHPFYSKNTKVIVAVGRIHSQKDYPTLLKAFQASFRINSDLRLVVLGGGNPDSLLEYSRELEIYEFVDFVGEVINPFPYIKYADLFVMSSRWEGLPNALIEALALGVPVVSTNCRSGPSEILLNGELSPLVNVGDWAALSEEITNITSCNRSIDRDSLIRRASDFTVEKSIKNYVGLLKGI